MRISLLTQGSRGDVQPYVGLGAALLARGAQVTVAAAPAFAGLIRRAGLTAFPVEPDPRLAADGGGARRWFRTGAGAAIRRLPAKALRAMYDGFLYASRRSEILIYDAWAAPAALAVAEALGLPAIPAYLAPLHPTRAFPSPFLPMPASPELNLFSHRMALWVRRAGLGGLPGGYRQSLGLPAAGTIFLPVDGDTCLYGFSRHLVPVPDDWPDGLQVTGPWWWDEPAWRPPPELTAFLEAPGKVVAIGFGSMWDPAPGWLDQTVETALALAGCRAVYTPGPGDRPPLRRSDRLMPVGEVPHAWVFPRVDAVVHHGGAGTTAQAARAGKPSVVVPYFGDQFFWARRVHGLGVGPEPIPRRRLTSRRLAAAIDQALSDRVLREQAEKLGSKVRAERGLDEAVQAIEAVWHAHAPVEPSNRRRQQNTPRPGPFGLLARPSD